ncbi:hypothetical protein LUZ60_018245 [Juncus effusus]|nr:hypothetical protein LUZ60_018412 [Juncus effusus]KAJ3668544.1 hypothetical protein LUZ60_018245 [Juncus effusus]
MSQQLERFGARLYRPQAEEAGPSGAQVAAPPQPQPRGLPPAAHNRSMESSMRNRISRLQKKGSPFVKFADPEVDYRRVVGANLRQPTSHVEYEGTLTAENRDLLVREGRDRCADLLKESALRDPRVLSQGEEGPKIVQEWLPDYFDELRKRQEAVEVCPFHSVGPRKSTGSYVRRTYHLRIIGIPTHPRQSL